MLATSSMFRDLFRGWGAISEVYIENGTKVLECVSSPPPKEPAIDNPVLIPACLVQG